MVSAPGVVTGRYGTIGQVFFVQTDFWPLNTTLYVRDFHGNDPLFISHFLRTIDFHTHSGKSGVPGVNRNDLHEIEVCIPAVRAEQEAIANALSDADALIESLEQLLTKKRQIKEGAMQELLTGKRRLPGFSGEWANRQVLEFGTVVTGGTPSTGNATFWGEGFPWITPTDISARRDMNSSERNLTAAGLAAIRNLPANSVLVTCIASIGKNAILTSLGGCNQQINAVVPNGANDGLFLFYLFENSKTYLLANAGTTATAMISKATFEKMLFCVPEKREQIEIGLVLSVVDAELDVLENKLTKARQIKQGMMQELLTGRIRLV
jgi:type I restriction enzyme, S subunit